MVAMMVAGMASAAELKWHDGEDDDAWNFDAYYVQFIPEPSPGELVELNAITVWFTSTEADNVHIVFCLTSDSIPTLYGDWGNYYALYIDAQPGLNSATVDASYLDVPELDDAPYCVFVNLVNESSSNQLKLAVDTDAIGGHSWKLVLDFVEDVNGAEWMMTSFVTYYDDPQALTPTTWGAIKAQL